MLSKLLSYIAITFPSLECAARRPDTRADSLFATTAAVSAANAGSFLCADSYCRRYRPAARRPRMIDTGMSHIGFRCILPAK
jgi:formylglycine-generating enzyme required for sulfatase activity